MISMSDLFKLKEHTEVEEDVLRGLFAMERSTLITLMLLETILLYILTPLLGNGIIAWYGIVMSLSLWRYYNAYDFEKHPERNTPKVWHEKFVVQVWLTALLFSILALFAMPNLDAYYQLFTFIVIVGISSGTVKALSEDHRTAVGYLIIMLFPLSVEMLLLMRKDTYILAFLVVIYFFTQISILLRSYEQSLKLKRREREIEVARLLLHQKQQMVQRFFEQASEALFTYNRNLKILDCNHSFLDMFRLEKSKVVGSYIKNLPDRNLSEIITKTIDKEAKRYKGLYKSSSKQEIWLEVKCSPIKDQGGKIVGGIGVIEDKTREHMARQELEYLVSHDPLTSVTNRRGFRQYMNQLINRAEHAKSYSLLFYLDLNKFKQINDMFGHEMGDWVLIETTLRLKDTIDEDCNLTRLGGDEFCIVVPYVGNTVTVAERETTEWIEKLKKNFLTPYEIDGRTLDVGCSIGAVIIEPGTTDVDEIVRHADISMLAAKKDDRIGVSVYSIDMGQEYRELYQMQKDMDIAIEKGEFELYFQPIYNIASNRLQAAEVLLRWKHPERGLLVPSEFLPMASKFGMMIDIDEWVIENAMKTIFELKERGVFDLRYLSINIDAKLLLKKDFLEDFSEKLKKYGIDHGEIKLEITEASLVDSFGDAQVVLKGLCKKGIECAIDDFGTGYSSLSYLKRLKFGILKIDRSFIQDMLERIENIFLVRTIIDMAKKLNYHIIVEGIEDEMQRKIIADIDPTIDYQGYLKSKPISKDLFINRYLIEGRED